MYKKTGTSSLKGNFTYTNHELTQKTNKEKRRKHLKYAMDISEEGTNKQRYQSSAETVHALIM